MTKRIKIKDIKGGDSFWEKRKSFVAVSDPVRVDSPLGEQWTIKGRDQSGRVIDFTETEGYSHYGPKLSTENEYPFVIEEGMSSNLEDKYKILEKFKNKLID
jgi:hypothetical protein